MKTGGLWLLGTIVVAAVGFGFGLLGSVVWWEWKEEPRIVRVESREDARDERDEQQALAQISKAETRDRITLFVAMIEERERRSLPTNDMDRARLRAATLRDQGDDLFESAMFPEALTKYRIAKDILRANCPPDERECSVFEETE